MMFAGLSHVLASTDGSDGPDTSPVTSQSHVIHVSPHIPAIQEFHNEGRTKFLHNASSQPAITTSKIEHIDTISHTKKSHLGVSVMQGLLLRLHSANLYRLIWL